MKITICLLAFLAFLVTGHSQNVAPVVVAPTPTVIIRKIVPPKEQLLRQRIQLTTSLMMTQATIDSINAHMHDRPVAGTNPRIIESNKKVQEAGLAHEQDIAKMQQAQLDVVNAALNEYYPGSVVVSTPTPEFGHLMDAPHK